MLSLDYSVKVTWEVPWEVIFEVFALLRGCRTTHTIWRRCDLTHAHMHTYVRCVHTIIIEEFIPTQ